jgi:hypothetical protein
VEKPQGIIFTKWLGCRILATEQSTSELPCMFVAFLASIGFGENAIESLSPFLI